MTMSYLNFTIQNLKIKLTKILYGSNVVVYCLHDYSSSFFSLFIPFSSDSQAFSIFPIILFLLSHYHNATNPY